MLLDEGFQHDGPIQDGGDYTVICGVTPGVTRPTGAWYLLLLAELESSKRVLGGRGGEQYVGALIEQALRLLACGLRIGEAIAVAGKDLRGAVGGGRTKLAALQQFRRVRNGHRTDKRDLSRLRELGQQPAIRITDLEVARRADAEVRLDGGSKLLTGHR